MNVKDYIRVLWPKLWLLILGTVLAAAACYLVATRYTNWPPYEARAIILLEDEAVFNPTTNVEGIKMIQQTIHALASRPPFTEKVVRSLELDIPAEDLPQFFHIEIPETTLLIEIIARHKNPELATKIANAVMQELLAIQIESTESNVLSEASIPSSPILTSYLLIMIAGALGFLLTTGGVLLAESFNNIIRHEKDIEQNLKSPLLGKIKYRKKRNGKSEASLNAIQWILTKIYIDRGAMPTRLLVTSPRPSKHQSDFVYMFVHCKVGSDRHTQIEDHSESIQPETQLLLPKYNGASEKPVAPGQPSVYDLDVIEWAVDQSSTEHTGMYRQSQVIDGPPVLLNANTVLMAAQVENVLLVVDANKTKISDTQKAEQLLLDSGAHVIGSVLLA